MFITNLQMSDNYFLQICNKKFESIGLGLGIIGGLFCTYKCGKFIRRNPKIMNIDGLGLPLAIILCVPPLGYWLGNGLAKEMRP